ncbi:MAG: prepilin-type N-terminal cleavage/methylation domain-containing protein [Myxococcales bacterium]|jgi:general secretion pathway protein J|nr:prepilin-type N-terminal cleavage/methylation domain-containing protein [Myxococcales bacterium]
MNARLRPRRRLRGLTLLEILVSVAVLALISMLLYGAFDSMSRGKKAEQMRADRSRQGRDAVQRMARELQGAFLSGHQPQSTSLVTRSTAFVGQNSRFDRLDFTAFAHRRVEKEAKESDQCELGYFVVKDPDVQDKFDLVRREQTPIDLDPLKGGVVNVVAEDVESFDIKYLDPLTGTWSESWDSTQVSGQLNRVPLEVRITLTLKGVKNSPPYTYSTKVVIPIREMLTFGVPR